MAKKTKKTKATAPTMSPMQAYITERLRQIDMVKNLDKKSQSRKALAGFVNNATETAVYEKHVITYNDEEVAEIAAKFKRLFCSLRAISFLYGKYACTLRDQANGLCNMGVYLRRIIDAFKQVDAKIIDSDIAYNLGMSATAVSNHRKKLGLTDYKRAKKVENDGK